MELDKDSVLEDLNSFGKVASETDHIPDQLEKFLDHIAKTGNIWHSWTVLKPLIKRKVELVSNEFNEKFPCDPSMNAPNVQMFKPFQFDEMRQVILESIDSFYGAPFTIQRLCELLTCPYKHYKRTDKFMRALEKNVLVVSTAEPRLDVDKNDFFFRQKNSTFYSSSTSGSFSELTSNTSSAYVNGVSDNEGAGDPHHISKYTSVLSNQNNLLASSSQHPAPLQQLDSFTTVFASAPSTTPLDVVSDIHNFDSKSPLSSGSSSSCSPQSEGSHPSPPPLIEKSEENGAEQASPIESNNETQTTVAVDDHIVADKVEDNKPETVAVSEQLSEIDQPMTESEATSESKENQSIKSKEEINKPSERLVEAAEDKPQQSIVAKEQEKREEEQQSTLVTKSELKRENEDTKVHVDTPRKRPRSDSPTKLETSEDQNITRPEKICKLNEEEPQVPESDVVNESSPKSHEPIQVESAAVKETSELASVVDEKISSEPETLSELKTIVDEQSPEVSQPLTILADKIEQIDSKPEIVAETTNAEQSLSSSSSSSSDNTPPSESVATDTGSSESSDTTNESSSSDQ